MSRDIFEVFAAEKKKREDKSNKLPELSTPPATTSSSKEILPRSTNSFAPCPNPQFRYQSNAEDLHLVSELEDYLMQGKLSLTTPAHIFAASPVIRKDIVDKLKVRRVETNGYEVVEGEGLAARVEPFSLITPDTSRPQNVWQWVDDSLEEEDGRVEAHLQAVLPRHPPSHCLPLHELDVLVQGNVKVSAIYDTGSQIVVIWQDIVKALGVFVNERQLIEMEGANGATNWTVGCAEYLTMQVGDVPFKIHAHVVEDASYGLLLGRPFQQVLLCRFEDLPGGQVELSVRDPANTARRIYVPTRPRVGRSPAVQIVSVQNSSESPISPFPSPLLPLERAPLVTPPDDPRPAVEVLKYKKVANKVRPVPATVPEDFRNIRRVPVDPLLSLPLLPTRPPTFVPGDRLSQERLDELDLNTNGFLWPEEVKLLHHILRINELGLAWTEAEKGRFRAEYFSPVKIPVVEHTPWIHKNLPIPPGIVADVIQIFKDKYAAGVFEHSDALYRSRWFCVKKKSGALRLVHDLQPLNAVTVRNSGVPPIPDQIIEAMAGHSCYTMLDLFVGYDHRTLDVSSRDLTTIQSPIGALRSTCLPQGWTNAGAIFHEDIVFILEPEIPNPANPFMDDCGIKGPPTRYETDDGGFETISDNDQIRRFVWEHLNDVHRILHRLFCAGATVSAKKLQIAVPEVIVLGHKCNYDGRVPDDSKIAKIRDWPACETLSDVRAFLGIAGYMRIWIKDFSAIARPLVQLTRKDVAFNWSEEHDEAMEALKTAIIQSPALISIDYTADRTVYLSVDSSVRGVGWILAQDCPDGHRRPARFGSISWNERESRYSQAKLELYGLFRALRAQRLHLVGVRNLVVEVDASYIKGMLSNPDVQPNAAINRWIAAILLFDFKLVHVPADKHRGPDGLSRREPVPGEDEEDNPEDWIDRALSLGTWVVSWLASRCADPLRAAALNITVDDDRPSRLRRDRRLPTRFRTGEYIASNPSYQPISSLSSLPREVSPSLAPSSVPIVAESPSLARSTCVDREPPAIKFPSSPESDKADEEVEEIERYLDSWRAPPTLTGHALTRFASKTRRFVIMDGRLWRRQADGRHQLYIPPSLRHALVRDAHDKLGHKGFYSTRRVLYDRFWWPSLETDVRWYVSTCHPCQICQTTQVRLPPTVDTPVPLFSKAYIDTMFMPSAGGYRYIVQARCSLTAWPEWRALRVETGRTIGAFIFEEILCRWGAVAEIVTDNGTAYVAALDWLAHRYDIRHIRISAYNSRANGVVEWQHRTIRDSIVKACDGDSSRWPVVVPFVFWADHATIRKSTGHSPFYMAHGIEPTLPFDITLATFLVPDLTVPLSTDELLAIRARQLEKRPADLAAIRDRILSTRFASARQFEKEHANTVRDFDFPPGTLVLVRNAGSDMDKTKPRFLGPMVVLRRRRNGVYRLGELDGAISRLRYAAFRLVPYHARSPNFIPVTCIVDSEELALLDHDHDVDIGNELTREGQNLNPPGDVRTGRGLASESSVAAHASSI